MVVRWSANVPNTNERTLGEYLRDARLEDGRGLRTLARDLEITPSYLSDIENDRRIPSEEVLTKIADELELDFDDLMARAFRFGNDVERYIKRNPAVGVLFRKLAEHQPSEEEVRKLSAQVDALSSRGRKKR